MEGGGSQTISHAGASLDFNLDLSSSVLKIMLGRWHGLIALDEEFPIREAQRLGAK